MDITYIPFTFPSIPNICCAFQTRIGGVSQGDYGGGNISFATDDDRAAVISNRISLCKTLSIDKIAEINQFHSDIIFFDPLPSNIEEKPKLDGDGLGTSESNLALLIKTADCQPILIAHKSGKHIAALHVGWKGNRINFIGKAIPSFCKHYNLNAKDICVVRGPSLSPNAAEFINFDKEWGADFNTWYNQGSRTVDLWELTKSQFEQVGILPQNIYSLDLCTYSMDEHFFSYRQVKKSGRQASLIWIKD